MCSSSSTGRTQRVLSSTADLMLTHDLYSAYGTGVALHVPLPHGNSVPFLEGEERP